MILDGWTKFEGMLLFMEGLTVRGKPEKPLTLHEVSVNEAAAQICRFIPALLTRRDELFPLARQVVKDSGCYYSKTQ